LEWIDEDLPPNPDANGFDDRRVRRLTPAEYGRREDIAALRQSSTASRP
jgi:hypothetical protein